MIRDHFEGRYEVSENLEVKFEVRDQRASKELMLQFWFLAVFKVMKITFISSCSGY